MADEELGVFFTARLDTADLEKSTENTKQKIEQLRLKQSELNTETVEGSRVFKENEKQLRLWEAQVKNNEKALSGLTDEEKANTDQVNFNNNSIKQNRELLKSLNAEYIRLQNPTKEQTDRLRSLTDTLKAQEAAVGNNARNVGNYKDALKEAVGGINVFGTSLGNLFRTILTNPIGILITAVVGLFQAFKRLEPVTEFLERAFSGLAAAFDSVVGAFGKLIDGDFSGFFEGITSGASDAAKEAYALTGALQDLEDAQRELNVTSAKNEAQIKNLLIQSKDRTKSEKERLALIAEAGRIEEDNFNQTLKIAEEEKRIVDAQLARAIRNNTANDELRDKAAQAEVKLIQLRSSSSDLQEKLISRRNLLLEEEQKNREAAAAKETARLEKAKADAERAAAELEKIRQKQEDDIRKRAERVAAIDEQLEQSRIALIENSTERQKEQTINSFQKRLELITGQSEEEAQLRINLEIAMQKELAEIDEKAKEDQVKRDEKALADKQAAIQKEIDEENKKVAAIGALISANGALIASIGAVAGAEAEAAEAAKKAEAIKGLIENIQIARLAVLSILEQGKLVFPANLVAIATTIGAIAAGISNIKTITGFAEDGMILGAGGVVRGPSHSKGGVRGTGRFSNVEVEGQEAVINKRSTKMYLPLLSKINQAGGGIPLRFEQGGLVGSSIVDRANSRLNLETREILRAISKIRPQVAVTEIRQKSNDVEVIERQATHG